MWDGFFFFFFFQDILHFYLLLFYFSDIRSNQLVYNPDLVKDTKPGFFFIATVQFIYISSAVVVVVVVVVMIVVVVIVLILCKVQSLKCQMLWQNSTHSQPYFHTAHSNKVSKPTSVMESQIGIACIDQEERISIGVNKKKKKNLLHYIFGAESFLIIILWTSFPGSR